MNLKYISLDIRGINKAIKRRILFRLLHNGTYDVLFYKTPIVIRQLKKCFECGMGRRHFLFPWLKTQQRRDDSHEANGKKG